MQQEAGGSRVEGSAPAEEGAQDEAAKLPGDLDQRDERREQLAGCWFMRRLDEGRIPMKTLEELQGQIPAAEAWLMSERALVADGYRKELGGRWRRLRKRPRLGEGQPEREEDAEAKERERKEWEARGYKKPTEL